MVENVNTNTGSNSTLNDTLGGKLTDREKWLMRRAWSAGYAAGDVHDPMVGMNDWLQEHAADGVTVEMALAKGAP